MMIRSKYSIAGLRMLFSAILLLFMFGIWTDGAQNISLLFDIETENYELPLESDTEPKEDSKKNKHEKEFDDFNYLTFSCSFIATTFLFPEANYRFSCSDLYSAVFTPPPELYTVIL